MFFGALLLVSVDGDLMIYEMILKLASVLRNTKTLIILLHSVSMTIGLQTTVTAYYLVFTNVCFCPHLVPARTAGKLQNNNNIITAFSAFSGSQSMWPWR